MRRDRDRATGQPDGRMPGRGVRAGAGGQDPDVEANGAVLGAAGVHTVRGPVERHARPPAPAANVRPDRRPTVDGRVQRAARVQLALAARRGRGRRVSGARAHRVPRLLRGRRRVLRGRHHPRGGPHQTRRAAHVTVFRRHADRRVHRRFPQRPRRFLRRVRRVRRPQLSGPVPGRRARPRHVRAVRTDRRVRLANGQPESDRRLRARADQETARPVVARLHDHRVAAHRRAHARYGYVFSFGFSVVVVDDDINRPAACLDLDFPGGGRGSFLNK